MEKTRYLSLFANCLLVKGFSQALLCDLQREKSHIIPLPFYELLLKFESTPISTVIDQYDKASQALIEDFLNFLSKNELAFYCDKKEREMFPPMSMEWDYPAVITNAIVDVDFESDFDFSEIFSQLDHLGCRHLQLRIYDPFPIEEITRILRLAELRTIKSIQIFVGFDAACNEEQYVELVKTFPRVTGLFLHSSEEEKLLTPGSSPMIIVAKIRDKLDFSSNCGFVDSSFFVTTMELFTESQKHNSCLNRKISVDRKGFIKNCPSMSADFGNIRTVRLAEALAQDAFTKLWKINKDQITICRDCEFRFICTDCRCYLMIQPISTVGH